MRHVPAHAAPDHDDPVLGPSPLATALLATLAVVALVVTAGTTLLLTGVIGQPEPTPRVAAPPSPSSPPSSPSSSPTAEPTATLEPAPTPSPSVRASTPGSAEAEDDAGRTRRAWARGLVEQWHEQRARAWSAGDEDAVRALYAPGSPLASADVERLRRWDEAGWRVAAQRTVVERVRVETLTEARVRLRVQDRLTAAVAADEQGRLRRLDEPSRASTRTWRMARSDGRWLLVSAT